MRIIRNTNSTIITNIKASLVKFMFHEKLYFLKFEVGGYIRFTNNFLLWKNGRKTF